MEKGNTIIESLDKLSVNLYSMLGSNTLFSVPVISCLVYISSSVPFPSVDPSRKLVR